MMCGWNVAASMSEWIRNRAVHSLTLAATGAS